uniref:Uncharacterized protein n=1 Tax=Ciona intestinalis TaxID=7719 RepID=H2XYV4_CIOIN
MGEVRAQSRYTTDRKRPSQFDRAQRINLMQSRTCMNQIEILENNIRKKLKITKDVKSSNLILPNFDCASWYMDLSAAT